MSEPEAGLCLRLATYNLKNLFLGTPDDLLAARRRAPPKKRRELRALARMLNRVDADVLALQEVGGVDALEAVNALCERPYGHVAVVTGNSDRGIHLAFMSRRPMTLTSHAQLPLLGADGTELADFACAADAGAARLTPLRLQRDLLRCELEDVPLVIFNAHFKSPNQPRWRRLRADEVRAAEARLTAGLLAELASREPDRPVCLLGDLNAEWESESLAPLRAAGLARVPSPAATPSFWPGGMTVDHVLVNAAARQGLRGEGAVVHEESAARRGSDHYPVSVCLAVEAR